MQVFIRGEVIDSKKEPIVLLVSEEEKGRISDMDPRENAFGAFPPGTPVDAANRYIDEAVGVTPPSNIHNGNGGNGKT